MDKVPTPVRDPRIAAVRRFNRFYTKQIGVLHEGLLDSPFSLAEVRIFYEIAHRESAVASEISRDLDLHRAYVSRLLASLERRGLVEKKPSRTDKRQAVLALTKRGREVFAPLEARSDGQVEKMLATLTEAGQRKLLEAMRTLENLLSEERRAQEPIVLRGPRPGDLGWVVYRHGALYAREYGWNEQFEGLVAGIVHDFVRNFDAKRERCWMAERNGEIVGSVFVVKHTETVAKLRMLLVEPSARGQGLGMRLVEEAMEFARGAGYEQMILWTENVLEPARRIYRRAGFHIVKQQRDQSFGQDMVSETWAVGLRRGLIV